MMAILSMSDQAEQFLLTVAAGVSCGFIYDAMRLIRHYTRHARFFIHLEDLLYWLLVTAVIFYIILNRGFGNLRAFFILGTFLGMALYFSLLSQMVLFVLTSFFSLLGRLLRLLFEALSWPVIKLFELLSKPVKTFLNFLKVKLSNLFKKIRGFVGNLLLKAKNYVKIKTRAMSKNLKRFKHKRKSEVKTNES